MIVDELIASFRGEVGLDHAMLERYSRDASIFEIKPEAVVFPKDVNDVKTLVKFATHKRESGERISLTARSGGTDMSGGPLTESIVVDFPGHFHTIHEVTETHAVVDPGVYFRDFEKRMNELGVMLPSYPASKEICTVGGMVANNSGGEKTLAYGKTEQYVEELHLVLSDGEEHVVRPLSVAELREKMKEKSFEGTLYARFYELLEKNYDMIHKAKPRVSKNSAGYYLWNVWDRETFDLTKLFVGSQGTLGLITKIKFRLVKKKAHSRLVVLFLKDLEQLVDIVHAVLKYKPESFESFDDNTLKLAIKFFPDIVRAMKAKKTIALGMQFLPEFFMVMTGGMPKLILLVELTSDDVVELEERTKRMMDDLRRYKMRMRLTRNEMEAKKYWTMRRESFNLLRKRIKNKRTAPFIDDVVVQPEKLPEFLPRLNAILKPYEDKMIYTIAGHAGNGNFHIIPLMDFHTTGLEELIHYISDKVYDLTVSMGGSVTAEHNDGLIRSPYLEKMYGKEIIRLFEETKRLFDPLGIFNPGKKVGSSIEYAMKHIART